jgi:hypothetical protein
LAEKNQIASSLTLLAMTKRETLTLLAMTLKGRFLQLNYYETSEEMFCDLHLLIFIYSY